MSAKRSCEVWWQVIRSDRSRVLWPEPRRQSAVRFSATVAGEFIVPTLRNARPGIERCVRSCKLVKHRVPARLVAGRLKLQWSPEEIAGWLRLEYPNDERRQVSLETICKTLFIQARGALKKELLAHLRQTRAMRRPRGHTLKGKKQGQIVDAVSIRERPAEAEDGAVPGHWEGDLIIGANQSQKYFPKGMDLSDVHQNHLNAIARRLNERPRKTLEYHSPAERFAERVASIG